ncbi:MAG: hypothetical protein H0S85_13625 [Desulfovibrionaceae bacterium]|nr:hypothetical protein [Desulfovibrionaceae bacterium]
MEYIAHRIFTRAASRIFIEKDPYDPARHQPGDLLLWWTFRARARSLDRVELETRGQTTCPKTGEIFHIRLPAPTDATA